MATTFPPSMTITAWSIGFPRIVSAFATRT
jgi:hypothetical protein